MSDVPTIPVPPHAPAPTAPPPDAAASDGARHPVLALAILVCCQLMVALDSTVVNIALPSIRSGLHMSTTSLSWVTNAYVLAFGGLLLLGGRAGDILGRRRLFVGGIVLFTAASLLGGLAPSAGLLLTARALQGVGAAFAAPGTLALIATNFAEGPQRNRALAAVTGAYALAFFLGLFLGGVITEWASWRWVLLINVPVGAAVAVLTPRFVNESQRHPGRFDLPGALLSGVGLSTLVYGFIRTASNGWGDPASWSTIGGGVLLLLLYPLVEARVANPITPLHLLRHRNRAGAFVGLFLLAGPMFGMFFFVTQYLQNVLGFGPLMAGVGFLPVACGLVVTGAVAARLLPRVGSRLIIVTGSALIIAGLAWLSRVHVGSGYVDGLLGPMVLFGFGAGLAFTAVNQVALSGVPSRDAGATSALLEAIPPVGGSLGLSVLVSVFGTSSRHAAAYPPVTAQAVLVHGMSSTFLAGAAIAVGSLLTGLLLIRGRSSAEASTP